MVSMGKEFEREQRDFSIFHGLHNCNLWTNKVITYIESIPKFFKCNLLKELKIESKANLLTFKKAV